MVSIYTVPNSAKAKPKYEQNPSEDVIKSVVPSLDLIRVNDTVRTLKKFEVIPGQVGESSIV